MINIPLKIAIIGRTEILYDIALALVSAGHIITCILTAKEAPEYERTVEDFRKLAENLNIPFAQGPAIINHIDLLRNADADIGVSFNYTGIVPQNIIDIFPMGILNVHSGDLPRYRGNACQAWAILNGESRVALCIHRMIGDELDSGDIIARKYLNIDHNTKVTATWLWMAEVAPLLMVEAINCLAVNPRFILERQSRDPKKALRCYPRRPEDGKIDWRRPALEVLRLINASNKPFSGAYCDFDGKQMVIWDAMLVNDEENFSAVPGQITLIGPGYVEVACGSGKLRIRLVQFDADEEKSPDLYICSTRKRLK